MNKWLFGGLIAVIFGVGGFFTGCRVGKKRTEAFYNNPDNWVCDEDGDIPLDDPDNTGIFEYTDKHDTVDAPDAMLDAYNATLNLYKYGVGTILLHHDEADDTSTTDEAEGKAIRDKIEEAMNKQSPPEDTSIQVISKDEWIRNVWEYEKDELIFFEYDEKLYDPQRDEIYEDADSIVGEGTLYMFSGSMDSVPETIYVCNEISETLYSITMKHEAWCDQGYHADLMAEAFPLDEDEERDSLWNDLHDD